MEKESLIKISLGELKMKKVRTPRGTELPILNLKGKDYLQVAHRLVWMREEHPEWGIETEFLQLSENIAIAKATIKDEDGRILAQGTKSETPKGFPDYIEKAESGSIGRALAMCGFGTQFTEDLDEGIRIVDAPQDPMNAQKPRSNEIPDFTPPSKPGNNFVSDGQIARLMAIANAKHMPEEILKAIVFAAGFKSRKDITRGKAYEAICKEIEAYSPNS